MQVGNFLSHPFCSPCVSLPIHFNNLHLGFKIGSYHVSSKVQEKKNQYVFPYSSCSFSEQLFSFLDRTGTCISTQKKWKEVFEAEEKLSTYMWWAELKSALGQRFNFDAIGSSAMVVLRDRHLAVPHVSLVDITHIDWDVLHKKGFKGVVFDKDNTITAPYAPTLWNPVLSSIDQCKSVFGSDIAIFSNSAGLQEYDPDDCKSQALERATGIRVIRHKVKKPSGTAEEIEKNFGCTSSHLVFVGDRHLTDIVFGNRNGFFTILCEPLSIAEEPFIVKQMRKLEVGLVKWWDQKGVKPPKHSLLPDATQCVKHS